MESARMPFQFQTAKSFVLRGASIVACALLAACNPTQVQNAGLRSDSAGATQALLGKAYVYEDDPIALTGNANLSATVNMGKLVSSTPKDIAPATKTTLTNDCNFVQEKYSTDFSYSDPATRVFIDCLRVIKNDDPTVAPIQPNNGSWVFPGNTSEFYQVNAMYHANKLTQRMLGLLSFIHKDLHMDNTVKSLPPAVPYFLGDMGTWWHKYNAGISTMAKSGQVTVQSQAQIENNAFYDPASNQVKLGYVALNGTPNGALEIQDPSVLYHELGHQFMTLFLNLRNAQLISGVWKPTPYKAFPLYVGAEELGALSEGIADYFSYFMNGRTTFANWGLQRFLNAGRPITEDNPLHAPGISSADDERLSYPDFLLYYPQAPDTPLDDPHNAGMITSHYLVALTEALKTECLMDQEMATNHVMLLMAESFAFLGDLTGRGTDYNNTNDGTGNPRAMVNLHRNGSYEWYYESRRIDMRRFFQVFARNIYHTLSRNYCTNFTKEKSEKLLDLYGLLLFRHYDDNGTFSDSLSAKASRVDAFALATPTGLKNSRVNSLAASQFGGNYPNSPSATYPNTVAPTFVDEANRNKSVLVPKSSLAFNASGAYATLILDDSQTFGQNVATNTLFQGRVISPSTGIAGWEYNNKNGKISPGEIVGISLNLVNNSNQPIAGVHLLATPWAHMKVQTDGSSIPTWKAKPCSINGFPSTSEGGLSSTECTDADILPATGTRFYKPTTGNYPAKALHPVCLVQYSSTEETRWVSQDEFRRNVLQLQDKECLGYGTPDFVPEECLMRFLPGRDSAFLSRIDPGKSFRQTTDPTGKVGLNYANGLALEVNKWITPGTTFTCRLRAQFSNCSDCFQSASSEDDYSDIEYGGAKPFRVLDIPLTILD